MVTTLHPKTPRTIKLEFAAESVTSFGGLVLAERAAARLRLWNTLGGLMPARRGPYDWPGALKALVMGLLSGAQGTFAAQALRQDAALLGLLSLRGAPEEATVWRMLAQLGRPGEQAALAQAQAILARRTLEKMERSSLLRDGFVPVFADGTLLEGSARREGTKWLGEKGAGLMWSVVAVGPLAVAQRLAGEGEGESTCVRALLGEVDRRVLGPLRLRKRALVLMDSLHGDEPTLAQLEAAGLHYIVGAGKLAASAQTLADLPEDQWEATPARARLGWAESGVCACWLQCGAWQTRRLLVGRRWRREGEMIWNYAGVLSDLRAKDLRAVMAARGLGFAQAVWHFYDAKAGMETQFKDALSDLGLHHPPCRKLSGNRGFYALGALAWTLGAAVDALGGGDEVRGSQKRLDGRARKRAMPRRMRLWRLRRELFTLPGRIARHGHELRVRILGASEATRQLFERFWGQLCRC